MIILGVTCILTMNEDIKHLIGDEVPEPIGWHRCSSNVIFQAFWVNMNLISLLMNFTYVPTLEFKVYNTMHLCVLHVQYCLSNILKNPYIFYDMTLKF